MSHFLFVYEEPQPDMSSFSHYLNKIGVQCIKGSAARIDGETFIRLEFGHGLDFAEAHSLLSNFKKSFANVGQISVTCWDACDVRCQKFQTLSEFGFTIPLAFSE